VTKKIELSEITGVEKIKHDGNVPKNLNPRSAICVSILFTVTVQISEKKKEYFKTQK
jgi:hypothetical protein